VIGACTRLAKDQTEINRIIAEASKGSKFYEARLFSHLTAMMKLIRVACTISPSQNEKKKDKDVTERIARILKQRDEALKGADVRESHCIFILIFLVI
jgi:DNA polymerase kappa